MEVLARGQEVNRGWLDRPAGYKVENGKSKSYYCYWGVSMVASAGETYWDLAATQFTKYCVAYNIIEF